MATAEFHNRAKAVYRANVDEIGHHLIKQTHVMIAIERHDAHSDSLPKDQYLWVKGRRKTPLEQVRQAYIASYPQEVQGDKLSLTLGNGHRFSATTVGELDFYADQIVALKAAKATESSSQPHPRSIPAPESEAAPRPSDVTPKSSNTPSRQPLQSVKRQLTVPPRESPGDSSTRRSLTKAGAADGSWQNRGSDDNIEDQPDRSPSMHNVGPFAAPKFEQTASAPSEPANSKHRASQDLDTGSGAAFQDDNDPPPSQEYKPEPIENPFQHQDEFADVPARGLPLRQLAEESQPERLEASVRTGVEILADLEKPLQPLRGNPDAAAFLQQIESARKEAVKSRTVVGVVGNTGAGKSSVINAMLDEERLVPTNCMRACTAVVTELSYNHSKLESSKYRAEIEFITPEEWRKELKILYDEVFDDSGRPSKDVRDPDSQAGIAYAKIRAVYNKYTQDMLGNASVDRLMREKSVQSVLGATRRVNERLPDAFYRRLQTYVDSREKGEEKLDKNGKRIGLKKRPFEYWPLIKVVRIYVKADALSTGAVIVDLPGVHDSNAARAAVAEGYMKQCSGLWIVAPINRAVDDKAAAKLLGDTFKRQLKFDGTYSAVTFICSKTDDISRTEATDSLNLGEEMFSLEEKLRDFSRERKALSAQLKEAKGKKEDCESVINDVDDKLEMWDGLKDDLDDGKTVYAPVEKSKKRKRTARASTSSRKKRRSSSDSDDEIEVISSEDEENEQDGAAPAGPPLTAQQINEKIDELKTLKKESRRERNNIDEQVKDLRKQITKIEEQEAELDDQAEALCIAGRNNYSRTAIKQDFAAGIRELDMETAEDEDADNSNPEEDIRDYEEVARSLPVFCVSSRAYQKLSDRLQKDSEITGFTTKEQTEIPQLQAHCKKLTENGRAANCRRFLNSMNRLVSSLALWASDDGTGPKMNAQQYDSEQRFLKRRLEDLERVLEKTVNNMIGDVQETMAGYVFDLFVPAVQAAAKAAHGTQAGWGAHRSEGGLFWGTYKAVTRRSGVFQSPAAGLRDFNKELTEPMMKQLQNSWEKTFQRKLPHILQAFSKSGTKLLKDFHSAIESRCREKGHGLARIDMLGLGLGNYEHVFNDASAATIAHINERQREINREFEPVITGIMQTAYDDCSNESGTGSYKRMKATMERFVDVQKDTMFRQACQHVRTRLTDMCEEARQAMLDRVETVFNSMKRDYLSLVGGVDVNQVQMPRAERSARRELDEAITSMDEQLQRVVDADLEDLRTTDAMVKDDGEEMEDADDGDKDEFDAEDDEDEDEDDEEDDDEKAEDSDRAAETGEDTSLRAEED